MTRNTLDRAVATLGRAALVVAAVASFVVTTLAVAPADAGAATPPVTITPAAAAPGSIVTVNGSGCMPGLLRTVLDRVVVTVAGTVPLVVQVAEDGTWTTQVALPQTSAKLLAVSATCLADGVIGSLMAYTDTVVGIVLPNLPADSSLGVTVTLPGDNAATINDNNRRAEPTTTTIDVAPAPTGPTPFGGPSATTSAPASTTRAGADSTTTTVAVAAIDPETGVASGGVDAAAPASASAYSEDDDDAAPIEATRLAASSPAELASSECLTPGCDESTSIFGYLVVMVGVLAAGLVASGWIHRRRAAVTTLVADIADEPTVTP